MFQSITNFFTPLRLALIAGVVVIALAAIAGFSIYIDRMQSQLVQKAEQAAAQAIKAEVAAKSVELASKAQKAMSDAMQELSRRNAAAEKEWTRLLSQTNGIPENDPPQDPVADEPARADLPADPKPVARKKSVRDDVLDAVNRASSAADRLLERGSKIN